MRTRLRAIARMVAMTTSASWFSRWPMTAAITAKTTASPTPVIMTRSLVITVRGLVAASGPATGMPMTRRTPSHLSRTLVIGCHSDTASGLTSQRLTNVTCPSFKTSGTRRNPMIIVGKPTNANLELSAKPGDIASETTAPSSRGMMIINPNAMSIPSRPA
jgi:hypothetical protein